MTTAGRAENKNIRAFVATFKYPGKIKLISKNGESLSPPQPNNLQLTTYNLQHLPPHNFFQPTTEN
ncbi:hypothetical protein DHB64_14530 [Antarcticibacterium sp. W02-3]|nr:hypothetical protein [Antarcticibacterium sp. W02-3]